MHFIITNDQLTIIRNETVYNYDIDKNVNLKELTKFITDLDENLDVHTEVIKFLNSFIIDKNPQKEAVDKYNKQSKELLENYPDIFTMYRQSLYIKEYKIPLNYKIVDYFYKSHKGETPLSFESLINFYRLLMLNPDTDVRDDIFEWFTHNNFVITKNGHIIGYRDVVKKKVSKLNKFVTKKIIKYIKKGKNIHNKYVVENNGEYEIVKEKDLDYDENKHIVIGKLKDLFEKIEKEDNDVFTDQYTRTMTIKLLHETTLDREKCDNDKTQSCSSGLHIKAYDYGVGFGDETLVCLVAPYDIVAVPEGERYKFRCCAYTPIAYAEKDENGKIIPFEEGDFDMKIFEGHLMKKVDLHMSNNYNKLMMNDVFEDITKIRDLREKLSKRIVTVGKNAEEEK